MGGIREASWRLDGDTRGFPRRAIQWFRDLQSVPKKTLLVAVALALLMLLSPLILVIAALVLVVSVIAFIIRVTQKGSVKGWGIVAAVSLIFMFVFGGISNAMYGTTILGSGSPNEDRPDRYAEGLSPDNMPTDEFPGSVSRSGPYAIDPSAASAPYYKVRSQDSYQEPGPPESQGSPHSGLVVFVYVQDTSEEAMALVVNDVALRNQGYDQVTVFLLDPSKFAPDGTSSSPGSDSNPAKGIVAQTPRGEEASRSRDEDGDYYVPEGQYLLQLYHD